MPRNVTPSMRAENRGAERLAAHRTRSRGHDQRKHTDDECERRHQNRSYSQTGGFHGCFPGRHPLRPHLSSELHYEYPVLGSQAHEQNKAYLGVEVVVYVPQTESGHCTEYGPAAQ